MAASQVTYVFAGPTATVTTTANQRLTGAATGIMGLANDGGAQNSDIGLCYQPAGGTVTNFSGGSYLTARFVAGDRRSYSATSSTSPGAGTWAVGMCVRNRATVPISDNDYVNGWVMVT